MPRILNKIISILIIFCLVFEQSGMAASGLNVNISGYLSQLSNNLAQETFRPIHLRYLSYDLNNNNFNILLDRGSLKKPNESLIKESTEKLLNYFLVGVTLPNDALWVNLRPDSPKDIIDIDLARTDVGRVMLEADIELKKDAARMTHPESYEGKRYWDNLHKKAKEIYGYDATIPAVSRFWIVPDEIILRESADNAYIYKATLKVVLEEDHLKDSVVYNLKDSNQKELNEYASGLLKENILPKLSSEVNTSKKYSELRQVYYSLILSEWFKEKFNGRGGLYSWLIDQRKLDGLTSKEAWSKSDYFEKYKKSLRANLTMKAACMKESLKNPFSL